MTVKCGKWLAIAMWFTCFGFLGCKAPQIIRYATVIGIKKEHIDNYAYCHSMVWPGVIEALKDANLQNYSIYLGEVNPDEYYLFSYLEYKGNQFDKDMQGIDKAQACKVWDKVMSPLQQPLPTRKEGEWWAQWQEVFHYQGPPSSNKHPKRVGTIIGIKDKESILPYTQLHAAPWPGVIAAIEKANIRNYSIYLGEVEKDRYLLFSYFEYVGNDFDADMKGVADDVTRAWWKYCEPLQQPLPTRKEGEWWSSTREVFHMD